MRNEQAQTPFILFSSLVTSESASSTDYRAQCVARALNATETPFKQLHLRVAGEEGTAPVFLVDAADKEQAVEIARGNGQSHLIEVNAFRVGTRVTLDGRQDAVLGKLEEVLRHTLEKGEGYLQVLDGGPTYVWK